MCQETSQHAPSETPGLKGTERSDAGGVESEGRVGAEKTGGNRGKGPSTAAGGGKSRSKG